MKEEQEIPPKILQILQGSYKGTDAIALIKKYLPSIPQDDRRAEWQELFVMLATQDAKWATDFLVTSADTYDGFAVFNLMPPKARQTPWFFAALKSVTTKFSYK